MAHKALLAVGFLYLRRDSGTLPAHTGPDFVLYRSIGNDLPPRHEVGQSYRNVKFILEKEPHFPGLEKRWVVNRIVNKTEEARIIDLLKSHQQQYVHLPFLLEEYATREFRFEDYHVPDIVHSKEFRGYKSKKQGELLDHVYHNKNRYIMHNNEARNAMLDAGAAVDALWILPWDGNCFLTAGAWKSIKSKVQSAGTYSKYFYVPMARLLESNEVLFDPNFNPKAQDEPQLIFRKDAIERFNGDMRYGRRSKVEMLWRLGVKGDWDSWCADISEISDMIFDAWKRGYHSWEEHFNRWTISKDITGKGTVPAAGWVARLYSGRPALETNLIGRGLDRVVAIRMLIDSQDVEAAKTLYGCDLRQTVFFDPAGLAADKAALASSKSAQEVLREIGARAMGDEDPSNARRLMSNVAGLALASYLTGRAELAQKARESALLWHSQATSVKAQQLSRDLRLAPVLAMFLDGLRLLRDSGALPATQYNDMVAWFKVYLGQQRGDMDFSKMPPAYWSQGLNGVLFDMHIAAIAAFVGDMSTFLNVLQFSKFRLLAHIDSEGRVNTYLEGVDDEALLPAVEMDAWVSLARMASRSGVRLFEFKETGRPTLQPVIKRGAEKMLSNFPPAAMPHAAHVYHASKPFYMDMACTCFNCENLVQGSMYFFTQERGKYDELPLWAFGRPTLRT